MDHFRAGSLLFSLYYLKGRASGCANAVLAASSYNFALLLRWLRRLLRALIQALITLPLCPEYL